MRSVGHPAHYCPRDAAPCRIVPFPARRRTGSIEHIAGMLAARGERAAAAYWQQILETLQRQMARAGIDELTITEEIAGFTNAVEVRLGHAVPAHQPRSRSPRGAA